MAHVRAGFLTSVVKSAGGVNYYRAKGEQFLRQKATLPADYQPTADQQLQRDVFHAARELAMGSVQMRWLTSNGFSRERKGRATTPYNQIMRVITRAVSRDPAGNLLSADERSTRREQLITDPADFFTRYCPLTISRYPPLVPSYTVVGSGRNIEVVLSGTVVKSYIRGLTRFSQGFNQPLVTPLRIAMIDMYQGNEVLENVPFNIHSGSIQSDGSLSFPTTIPSGAPNFWYGAFFFPDGTGALGSEWPSGAISEAGPGMPVSLPAT